MHRFRRRLRLSSCIALFALAFQLAVSFGHVHLDDLVGHSSVTIEPSGATAPAPAGDGPSDPADHYCSICALVHLAAALVSSQPPVMPLPIVFAQSRPDAAVKFGFA